MAEQNSNMSSIMGADASRILAGLAAAVDGLPDLDVHTLIRDERLAILRDVETVMRRIPAGNPWTRQ